MKKSTHLIDWDRDRPTSRKCGWRGARGADRERGNAGGRPATNRRPREEAEEPEEDRMGMLIRLDQWDRPCASQ